MNEAFTGKFPCKWRFAIATPFQRGGLRPVRAAGRQVGGEVLRGHVGKLEEDLTSEGERNGGFNGGGLPW